MRRNRWFYLLLITTMLLSSCQAKEMAASDSEAHPSLLPKVDPLTVSVLAQQAEPTAQIDPNECLDCHEDKERLIETAKEEEVAEAESSGVG